MLSCINIISITIIIVFVIICHVQIFLDRVTMNLNEYYLINVVRIIHGLSFLSFFTMQSARCNRFVASCLFYYLRHVLIFHHAAITYIMPTDNLMKGVQTYSSE